MRTVFQGNRQHLVFHRIIKILLILCGLLSISTHSAQANQTIQANVYSGTLEQAVQIATHDQTAVPADAEIVISQIAQKDAWVFGTSAIIPATDEEEPKILLFLAEQTTDGWSVAIEHTEAFDRSLQIIPQGLLSQQQLATMANLAQIQGNGSMQLGLPWAVGETQYFTGGPHGTNREAIDFSGGTGIVRAVREGVAYTPCGTASDYVRVDHGGGLSTHYYHLSGISIANGQTVARGTQLGRQSTSARCLRGYSNGAHVHFWISQNNVKVPINGIDIGGWTVSAGARDYHGCMTRVRDGLRKCTPPFQPIPNEGAIGSGIPPKMDVNHPGSGITVNRTTTVTGWAIHEAAANGTGVDMIHIYFDGPAGSGARGVAATYGVRRDDVAAAFGERFRYAGYELLINTAELSLGQHTLYVYAHSTVTDRWQMMTRSFTVINTPPNMLTQAIPANGATVNGPTVQFSWQDPGDFDNRPRTYRDYTIEVRNSTGTVIAQMPWTATTTWNTQLADGVYTWRIQSGDGAVGSGWSDNWTFTVSNPVASPDRLVGTIVDGGIRLVWTDNSSNETGFRIYRRNSAQQAWMLIGTTTQATFTDRQIMRGNTYYYTVSAFSTTRESERTAEISITIPYYKQFIPMITR